ncbi:MAG: hypothetical protein VX627_05745 [Candidatus Thermoplasmatota archaeon]|nr:hypothetical protein [Candidatus Thermoplasmatota archaeon]
MTSPANVGSFVVPGTTVLKNDDESLGRGIIEQNGGYVATVVGILNRTDGILFVEQKTDPIREIEVGDVVIGEVNRINPKTAEIRILHVEGKPVRSLPATHLFADIFVAKIVDRFMPSPGDAMRKRDLIRAKIEQLEPMLRAECRSDNDLGVLQAICPACGEMLEASSAEPDVNVACNRCDYVGFRALSNAFGHGYTIPEGGELSALNRDGERWSKEATFISKDGERPYLSPLADHRRGSSHSIPKDVSKFLGTLQQGGRGGKGGGGQRQRRQMHKAKCTMCGCDTELPFEPTPGAPARCSPCKEKVDKGEATTEELAEERKTLQVAREAAKETMGMKLFVGGVPYSVTEEQLTELFAAHGELKEVHIATDKETGKSKGFAFITFKSHKEGAAAIEALKGTKIEGRKLTIQESNRGGGRGGRGGRGGQGGRDRGRRDRR